MKPNEAHIAHLILAFQDGSISSAEKLELDELILAYPAYAHDLEPIKLQPPTNENCAVSHLLRPEYENLQIYNEEEGHPYDKLAIGSLEGLLNTDELLLEASLQQDALYIKNKQKYVQTILNPDQSIVYPYPNNLIKKAPVRRLTFKKMAVTMSSAAAILLVVMAVYLNASVPASNQRSRPTLLAKKPIPKKQDKMKEAGIIVNSYFEHHYLSNLPNEESGSRAIDAVKPDPRDCIAALQNPNEQVQQFGLSKPEICPTSEPEQSQPNTSQENAFAFNSNPAPSNAFTKEPITIKSFIIQKTNQRLFGTPAPSTDLRYETMARYASETIGLPMRYEVEYGAATDKIIFQFGSISIERNRSKK